MRLFHPTLVAALFVARSSAAQTPIEGRWQGEISRQGKPWPVAVDVVREGGGLTAYLDFPAYGLYYRKGEVAAADSSVRITYVSGSDTIVFGGFQHGAIVDGQWSGLRLSATFALRRIGDAPPRLVEESVHFSNGEVVLSGRLVMPAGTGPWPAVVWTHGSGRQSRDADFYRDRAYLLASRGVAGLIYDKRGVGESTGDPDATLDELAGDAVAGATYLRSRPDVRTDRVGVAGFSQGGWVAPLAATRYGQIAFVLVGSAGVTPQAQNDFAAQADLKRAGAGPTVIEQAMELRQEVVQFYRTGMAREKLEAELAAVQSQTWFRAASLPPLPLRRLGSRGLSVLDFDPVPVWADLAVPVLAMWGADDQVVPAMKSKLAIESAMSPSTRARSTLRVFPQASHGLLVVQQPGASWDWPRLATGFHELMADWIVARTIIGHDQR